MLGTTCLHARVAGLFEQVGSSWRQVPISTSGESGDLSAISITTSSSEITVTLASVDGTNPEVAIASEPTGAIAWTTSKPLRLPVGASIRSFGPLGGVGVFVVAMTPHGGAVADLLAGPTGHWIALADLPSDVETLVAPSVAAVEAIAAKNQTMRVYRLVRSPRTWSLVQTLEVGIIYGSSS
jgi:hypothetical protein